VVEETGFSIDTLRYYERIGLLHDVPRTASGQRRFTGEHLDWLGLIRCLRETGMPIAEMVRYAELVRAGEHTVPDRISLLEQHDQRVRAQIAGLRDQQRYIQRKVAYYRTLPGGDPARAE
jgi:DNA-binding transcriptional MerR regulator